MYNKNITCGGNSVVECLLAKEDVASSSLVSRSIKSQILSDSLFIMSGCFNELLVSNEVYYENIENVSFINLQVFIIYGNISLKLGLKFMKSLVVFFISLQHMHVFMKTRNGIRFENFQTESSENLSPILTNYLNNAHVTYHLYKMPNYVVDFLKYNNEFSTIYKNKQKATMIIFSQDRKSESSATGFYYNAENLYKKYNTSYNLIVRNEVSSPDYIQYYDKVAYKDLREYCSGLCILNPSNDTMFTFKRITNSESEALEAVFQQYKQ